MAREKRIFDLLTETFSVSYLRIEDETKSHNVPDDLESHFKIILVSGDFSELSKINRHRQIHTLLTKEFSQGLHALSLHLFTPSEWENAQLSLLSSPTCKNGFKNIIKP